MFTLLDSFGEPCWIIAAHSRREDDTVIPFDSDRAAFVYLRQLAWTPSNLAVLRRFLSETGGIHQARSVDDESLLAYIAARLASGQWYIIRPGRTEKRVTAGGRRPATKPGKPTPPTPPESAPPPSEKTWIKFEIVDDETGQPVSGVTLKVRLPDGQERTGTSNASGLIEFAEITPGTCDILKMIDSHTLEVVSIQ